MKKVKYSKSLDMGSKAEKKKIRKELLWGIFIAVIMISSTIGFIYSGGSSDFTYKDKFKFKATDSNTFIYSDSAKQQFVFRYLPPQVEDLNLSTKIVPPMVYVSFNPNSSNLDVIELMRFELVDDFAKLNIYAVPGVSENGSIYDLPIINCINASIAAPVIFFSSSNETKIIEKNGCLVFEAKDRADIVRLKERLLYSALGVME
jgi:hypothetical protein